MEHPTARLPSCQAADSELTDKPWRKRMGSLICMRCEKFMILDEYDRWILVVNDTSCVEVVPWNMSVG